MSQRVKNDNFKPGSLRRPRTARTVLLRMAADDERAQRISALKNDRPDLTWRRIADQVGVSERAAFEWKKTGGIDYANAEKLADVFSVDVDYIWTGAKGETPDLFPAAVDEDVLGRLDRIEAMLLVVLDRLQVVNPDVAVREAMVSLGQFAAREELAAEDAQASTPARVGQRRQGAK